MLRLHSLAAVTCLREMCRGVRQTVAEKSSTNVGDCAQNTDELCLLPRIHVQKWGRLAEGDFAPLVTQKTFDRVQMILHERAVASKRAKPEVVSTARIATPFRRNDATLDGTDALRVQGTAAGRFAPGEESGNTGLLIATILQVCSREPEPPGRSRTRRATTKHRGLRRSQIVASSNRRASTDRSARTARDREDSSPHLWFSGERPSIGSASRLWNLSLCR